jgi:DNA (cytosine-5)-methyltransferase 1
MNAYYNEIEEFCCAWLSNLMDAGLITPGKIDQRSIEDVSPDELRGYERCHFFAGIGVWDLALNRAGWAGPIWTGSCPCQPFSAAGKGGGFADERHLWPAFFHLIQGGKPISVLGEQVSSKAGLAWLDLVQTDLENAGYSTGALDTCAAGVGAPHIRQRLYWVAHTEHTERWAKQQSRSSPYRRDGLRGSRNISRPADPVGQGLEKRESVPSNAGPEFPPAERNSDAERLEQSSSIGQQRREGPAQGCEHDGQDAGRIESQYGPVGTDQISDGSRRPGPTNGLWEAVDWLYCRDEKWRPVEPETFPLADAGTFSNRVAELRGAGNAINIAQAQIFIESVMEVLR